MRAPMVWRPAAVAGLLLAAAGFLWLPWAAGSGPLAGRSFTGVELARLVHNADALIDEAAGGPVAVPLALALYGVPVTAVAAVVVLLGAAWTSSPAGALRAAAAAGALVALMSAVTIVLLVAGPAGDNLDQMPRAGALLGLAGGMLGCAGAMLGGGHHAR
jgi:hypothetical protein